MISDQSLIIINEHTTALQGDPPDHTAMAETENMDDDGDDSDYMGEEDTGSSDEDVSLVDENVLDVVMRPRWQAHKFPHSFSFFLLVLLMVISVIFWSVQGAASQSFRRVFGNFNSILYASEKQGGSSRRSGVCDMFKNWFNTNRMYDLQSKGPRFTWSRGSLFK